jgi:RNA polymerase sigma-70 factor (ECF subfamily)
VSDAELARQSQAGSMPAFEELVYRYEQRVYGFAFQCSHSREDAREIAQDTFVKAFQALSQFDTRQSFAAWIFTICRHKCIDRLRRARPSMQGQMAPELADHVTPAETLARQEDTKAVWALAARHLPPAQLEALWLRYVDDLGVDEIARVLHRTQTHIKVLLFRARKTLAARLQPVMPSLRSEPSSLCAPNSALKTPL